MLPTRERSEGVFEDGEEVAVDRVLDCKTRVEGGGAKSSNCVEGRKGRETRAVTGQAWANRQHSDGTTQKRRDLRARRLGRMPT